MVSIFFYIEMLKPEQPIKLKLLNHSRFDHIHIRFQTFIHFSRIHCRNAFEQLDYLYNEIDSIEDRPTVNENLNLTKLRINKLEVIFEDSGCKTQICSNFLSQIADGSIQTSTSTHSTVIKMATIK